MTKKREKKNNSELPASLCHVFIAHSQQLLSGRLPPVRSTRCLNRLFKYFYCWFLLSGLEYGGVSLWKNKGTSPMTGLKPPGSNERWLKPRRGRWPRLIIWVPPLAPAFLFAMSFFFLSHCGVISGDGSWPLLRQGAAVLEGRLSGVLLTSHLNWLTHAHFGSSLLLEFTSAQGLFHHRGREMALAFQSKGQ